MNIRIAIRVSLTSAVLAVASGCAIKGQPPLVNECSSPLKGDRTGPALVGEEYGRQATPIPLDSVQYSNWRSAKSISVQRLFAARTPTNTVEVTARVVSCMNEPIALLVRTSFLDGKQAPTEPSSAWRPIIVQPRMTAVYSERSTSTRVANYLIEIMPGT